MLKAKQKRKLIHVAPEDVKAHSSKRGGRPWLKLPPGVREWKPEKAGVVMLDFLPYVITDPNNPMGFKPNTVWYNRMVKVFHNIGPNQETVVSPASFGKPCPLSKEKAKLSRNRDENEEALKALRTQDMIAYVIKDPDDEDKIAVYVDSFGKFGDVLEKELHEGDKSIQNFYECGKRGHTLKVRFSEETFAGHKYLQASRIDFVPRKPMDEEEILGKVPNLDEIFVVKPAKVLEDMYLQIEDDAETEDGEDDDELPKKKVKPAKNAKAAADEDEDEPDLDEDEAEDDDEDLDDEEDDADPEDDDDDEESDDEDEDEDEDSDEEDDEEDDEEGDDDDEEDDDEDDTDEDETDAEDTAPAPKKGGKGGKGKPWVPAKGAKITFKEGKKTVKAVVTMVNVDSEIVTAKDAEGTKYQRGFDEITKDDTADDEETPAPRKRGRPPKAKPEPAEEEDADSEDDDDDEESDEDEDGEEEDDDDDEEDDEDLDDEDEEEDEEDDDEEDAPPPKKKPGKK